MATRADPIGSKDPVIDPAAQKQSDEPKGNVIWIALIILGIVGVGTGLTGAIGLTGWSTVLQQLGHTNSIVMTSVGGGLGIIFLIAGIVKAVKQRKAEQAQASEETPSDKKKKDFYPLERLEKLLVREYDYTYVLRPDGRYALYQRKDVGTKWNEDRTRIEKTWGIVCLQDNIEPLTLKPIKGTFGSDLDNDGDLIRRYSLGLGVIRTSLLPARAQAIIDRIVGQTPGNIAVQEAVPEILDNYEFRADPKAFILANRPPEIDPSSKDPKMRAWMYIVADDDIVNLK